MSDYWLKFPVTASYLEPCVTEGTILELGEIKTAEGHFPRLTIKSPLGQTVIVNAVQTRLVSELVRLKPRVGDKIRINYRGPAKKAPPGLSPTKEFAVEVWPQGSQTSTGAESEASGGVGSENAPRSGK
jgi:hypothetical protein